ncbi:MAG: hypothetical protein JHC61_06595 [Burkholderiaceae bacterium]|nr:hypothetical protein [Burkholderiaceae bacterium]
MTISIGNNAMTGLLSIGEVSIDTAIQTIQKERATLLNGPLMNSVKAVQSRNDQITKLNDVLVSLYAYNTQINGKDAGDKPKDWAAEQINLFELPLNDAIQAAGIKDLGFESRTGQCTPGPGEHRDGREGKLLTGTGVVCGSTTKGEIETAITKIKAMIDVELNNQQMDMLRVQSLNNKKNESVEILTTTQKKHSD